MSPFFAKPLQNKEAVTNMQMVFYSLPAGTTALLYGGPLVVVQGVYAKYYGLSLSTIASILLIANLFDTITDPIVGYFSDDFYARTGTRKPFVFCGSLVFIFGAYWLFIPPKDVSSGYFLVCFLLFYLGFTIFNIPHHAWGSEISSDSRSSIHIFTLRAAMMTVGGMLFYAVPQLPFFGTPEFTPETLKAAVLICGILTLPALYLCLYFVPNRKQLPSEERSIPRNSRIIHRLTKRQKIIRLWMSIVRNKPFLLFLGAFFMWGVGSGSWVALLFIFIDAYLGMGKHFSLIALIGMGCGAVGLCLWLKLAIQFGKIVAWIIGTIVAMVSIMSMILLTAEPPSFIFLALIIVPGFISMLSFSAFAPALLSDIIDYSTWKFGHDFTGSYFSVYFLVTKTNYAIGGAMGLAIAGWYGFDPSSHTPSQEAIFGLQLGAIWLPSLFLLLSIYFICRIPINARRHNIICQALARRRQRNIFK